MIMRHPLRLWFARTGLVFLASLLLAQAPAAWAAGRAEHVVVLVFDGLRPDSITEEDTPALCKLAKSGTTFAHHHPVYLSSTEVNGTALATGVYPRHSGVIANTEYRPGIELLQPIATESDFAVYWGDVLSKGEYLHMPTVAELLRREGRSTVVAGTKPVALLLDRTPDGSKAANYYAGRATSPELSESIRSVFGPMPPGVDAKKRANRAQDAFTTRILVERLWNGRIPQFTMLWLSEPDYAQHGTGVGSKVARSALRSSDDDLAAVLRALDAAGAGQKTDVMVVSDHGFCTVSAAVDLVDLLKRAGFRASREFEDKPADGQVLVAGSGGSVLLYVAGHSEPIVRRLVSFLQCSDFAGVIFTRQPMEGTFALTQAGIDTPDAPDIVVSMRWSAEKSLATGVAGLLMSEGKLREPGQGNHGSLSAFDMHNTLVAAGPDFRGGFVDDLPSGNSDVAPTVMWILGAKTSKEMDGRILGEAIIDGPAVEEKPQTSTIEAKRQIDDVSWRQYLRITRLGPWTYYEEGNGGEEDKKQEAP